MSTPEPLPLPPEKPNQHPPSRGNYMKHIAALTACGAALAALTYAQSAANNTTTGALPPQAVFIDPRKSAVLGLNGSFRNSSVTEFFNPTNNSPPFIQVFDPSFLEILGPQASLTRIANNDTFAFAHEGPIWDPVTDRLFFASQDGGTLGFSGPNASNVVSFIDLKEVDSALRSNKGKSVNVAVTQLDLPESIQMTNGGTGPHGGNLLLITSGRETIPPALALVNPNPPHNVTVILDNFFGRQFNSLNDIKVHPRSGNIFFTDVTYGALQNFRPPPMLPNQVYRFDPMTSAVRVVADQFDKCNGIAFTPDGNTAYVSDTGINNGFFGINQTEPATIYAFDVDPVTEAFSNRRVFAYVDTGIPDGIQVDLQGNVFSGTGDGVQVWNAAGTLLGKFFLGTVSANMVFASNGRLFIMAETAIYLAQTAARGQNLNT